ncbi:hypothetical protein DPMN_107229 [Dreissena polymorpha]|uniref:Uncharacterized protein n=1 Tax=Dreissena polymorpha TaxID=45954 RepID=A0A9D4K6H3_DREPO|nr:hypothetical protein DPMN_107229 [Dreissena polymorpha]
MGLEINGSDEYRKTIEQLCKRKLRTFKPYGLNTLRLIKLTRNVTCNSITSLTLNMICVTSKCRCRRPRYSSIDLGLITGSWLRRFKARAGRVCGRGLARAAWVRLCGSGGLCTLGTVTRSKCLLRLTDEREQLD